MALKDLSLISGVLSSDSVTSFNRSVGPYVNDSGSSPSQGFYVSIIYEDVTNSVLSFTFDAGGPSEGIGEQVAEFTDTNKGVKGEIWWLSKILGSNDVGHVVLTMNASLSGVVNVYHMRYVRSTIDAEWGPHQTDVATEQVSGLIGGVLSDGSVGTIGLQVLASNETVPTNYTQETAWGLTGDIDTSSAFTSDSTYGNIASKHGTSEATDWGWSAMTVGGGSACFAVFSEGGVLPSASSDGPKAPLMQFPLGSGDWLMSNGILTR